MYEHRIPVASGRTGVEVYGRKDMSDLAGGETIDLSGLEKANMLHVRVSHLHNTLQSLQSTDYDEMPAWRVEFKMSETFKRTSNPSSDGTGLGEDLDDELRTANHTLKNIFMVYIDASDRRKITRIRVSFEDDNKFTSYTSKNHNIILPQWMRELTSYKIMKAVRKI